MNDATPEIYSDEIIVQPQYRFLVVASLIMTIILSLVSILGLVISTTIYPSQVLREFFMTNDLINLIIGVPILLGSMWLAHRNKLIGLLFWPGTMMYVLYNYIAYMVAMPINWIYPLYCILVLGSLFLFFYMVFSIDAEPIGQRLSGSVKERLSAGLLIIFGVGFLFRAFNLLADPVLRGNHLPTTDLSVLIADIVLSLAWISGGLILWQKKMLGYVFGGALLFQGATLFIGLILFLLFNPLLTEAEFNLIDVIIVIVMSLICNIPFAFYIRGVLQAQNQFQV